MIPEKYKEMLQSKSVIRELAAMAAERSKKIGAENVFNYSIGNPSVPTPQAFNDKLINLIETETSMSLHGYSPTHGIPSVMEAIAESLNKRFDMNYTKGHIYMTTGAAGALAHALRAVTNPGDSVLVFAPFFSEYTPYIKETGANMKIVPADTKSFQINLDKFEEMLTSDVTAVLINTPNNPSGTVYTKETLTSLADILRKKQEEFGHEIYLISDEPYREIIFAGVTAPYAAWFYDNTITCYSFSKSVSLPGERLGYVAVSPKAKDADILTDICAQISRGIGHNCPSSIIQLGITSVLYQTSDMSVYETNMNILYNGLKELGFEMVKPDGTFYIFPKALEKDSRAFTMKATKYNLFFVPGDTFGCPGYFRLSYCFESEKVERSLEAFRKFVKAEY